MAVDGFPAVRRNSARHRDVTIQSELTAATPWGDARWRLTLIADRLVPEMAGFAAYFGLLGGAPGLTGPEQCLDRALEDVMNEVVPRYVRVEMILGQTSYAAEDRQPGFRGQSPVR